MAYTADLLTEREAARVLGISHSQLKRRRLAGDASAPAHVRLGPRTVRYHRRELERFVAGGARVVLEHGVPVAVSGTLERGNAPGSLIVRLEVPPGLLDA